MTAYSITVANSIRTFGGGPSDKWAEKNWNAFLWGEGTNDIPQNVRHLLATSPLVPTSAMPGFAVTHKLTTQTITPTTGITYRYARIIANSLLPTSDVPTLEVQDPANWLRGFSPPGTPNASDRTTSPWSGAASAAVSWTTATAGSTIWSDA